MLAFASETLTVAGTAVGFSTNLVPTVSDQGGPDVRKAVFVVEGAPIRVTVDGTTPTSSVGMLFQVGDVVTIEGEANIKRFKAIRATSTSASAYVTYFK